MWGLLARPIVWAIAGGASAYYLYKKNQDTGEKLKQSKLELLEQQRTIDRLRAEVGRERHMRQEAEKHLH